MKFRLMNVFACFYIVVTHVELVEHDFPNKTTLHFKFMIFKSHKEKRNTQRISTQNTAKLSHLVATVWTDLVTRYSRCKLAITKT